MPLDLDALTKRVSETVGGPPSADPGPAEPGASSEGGELAPTMAELGARFRAAYAHGDDEALAQVVQDISRRGR